MPDHASSADIIVLPAKPRPRRQPRRIPAGLLPRMLDVLLAWQERARERRHLLSLSDHALKDVGLTRADLEGEAARPFWQP